MSIQIGIDLVSAQDVKESVQEHGDRYLARIYTEDERRECRADPTRLAARFAAKEATMKALGRDNEALDWRSIGVHLDACGRPSLQLTGAAAELAQRRGVTELSVSLTEDGSLAAAVVLAKVGS